MHLIQLVVSNYGHLVCKLLLFHSVEYIIFKVFTLLIPLT